jgi:glycosyltransferase involved in cell wall biosynthesis
MAFSLPLIVVDRGGPGSATSEQCAVKLSVTTPEALAGDIANAVRKLALDKDLRLRMGVAAYQHVAQTALWSAKLDRMDEIYADVISMFQRRSAA